MKRLFFVLFLLALVVLGVGFFRGWFTASTAEAGGKKGLVFTWDKDRFAADMTKASDQLKSLSKGAADKIKGRAKTVSESESELTGKVTAVDAAAHTITVDSGGEAIALVVPDTAGIEQLQGKSVRVTLEKTADGYVVRRIAEL